MTIQHALFEDVDDLKLHEPSTKEKSFAGKTLAARVLLLGGGVQSGTLAEMIAEGVLEAPDVAIFSDTGDEPWWVYQMIGRYRARLAAVGTTLLTVHRDRSQYHAYGSLMRDIMHGRVSTSLPLFVRNDDGSRGRLRRQCTDDYKVTPNNKAVRAWLLKHGHATATNGNDWWIPSHWRGFKPIPKFVLPEVDEDAQIRVRRGHYVEMWFGISTDETYRAGERGPQWQKTRYPLLEHGMSREDCVRWLRERGLPVPMKSACTFCPYKSDESWQWLKDNHPKEFEDCCRFDDWLRSDDVKRNPSLGSIRGKLYLHISLQPLREVEFLRPRKSREHDMFGELMFDTCSTDGAWSCFS